MIQCVTLSFIEFHSTHDAYMSFNGRKQKKTAAAPAAAAKTIMAATTSAVVMCTWFVCQSSKQLQIYFFLLFLLCPLTGLVCLRHELFHSSGIQQNSDQLCARRIVGIDIGLKSDGTGIGIKCSKRRTTLHNLHRLNSNWSTGIWINRWMRLCSSPSKYQATERKNESKSNLRWGKKGHERRILNGFFVDSTEQKITSDECGLGVDKGNATKKYEQQPIKQYIGTNIMYAKLMRNVQFTFCLHRNISKALSFSHSSAYFEVTWISSNRESNT